MAGRDTVPYLARVDLIKRRQDEDELTASAGETQRTSQPEHQETWTPTFDWCFFCGLLIPFGVRNFTNDAWLLCQKPGR